MRGRIIEETIEPVYAQKLNAEMNLKGVEKGSVPPIYTKGGTLAYFQVMADGPRGEAVLEVRYWVGLRGIGPAAARCRPLQGGACRAPTLNRLFPNPTEQGQEVAVEDTVDVRLRIAAARQDGS